MKKHSPPHGSGMICVSIGAAEIATALTMARQAQRYADVIEIRLDLISSPAVSPFIEAVTCPLLFTNRPVWEGGAFAGSEEERIQTLEKAITEGAAYIDVELRTEITLRDRILRKANATPTRIISSWHDFNRTPSAQGLEAIFQEMYRSGAHIGKIVTMAADFQDVLRVLGLQRTASELGFPLIAFAMGEAGKISRLATLSLNGFMTYAALDSGHLTAPGQMTAADIHSVNALLRPDGAFQTLDRGMPVIDGSTRLCGIMGKPVAHSLSPVMHNAAYRALGLNMAYVPFEVDAVDEALHGLAAAGVKGLSVTVPHKEAVLNVLDEIDPVAAKIGAVNTICFDRGRAKGFNTDWLGSNKSLAQLIDLEGKQVVILGAGGSARAIGFGLLEAGAEIVIASRTPARGLALAAILGCPWHPLAAVPSLHADALVNATTVGMEPHDNESPVPLSCLPNFPVVMDIVYAPLQTRLLREAASCGAKTINGLDMLLYQAAAQVELWTGMTAPLAVMKTALHDAVARKKFANRVEHENHHAASTH